MDALQTLTKFVGNLQDVEYSGEGPPFHLSVKYRGDNSVYVGWPLPRGEYITSTGLRDPGFGSGPVEFSQIEWVSVHSAPQHHPSSPAYRAKFSQFIAAVQSLTGVSVTGEAVTYNGV